MKHYLYEEIGRLSGRGVFKPRWPGILRGLCIEEDGEVLRGMTPEEIEAWRSQETDQREGPSSVTRNVRLGLEEW